MLTLIIAIHLGQTPKLPPAPKPIPVNLGQTHSVPPAPKVIPVTLAGR